MIHRITLCIILIGIATHAYACKCASDPGTVSEEFKRYALVIHGKVISKKLVAPSETIQGGEVSGVRARLQNDKQKLAFFDAEFIYEVKIWIIEKFKGVTEGKTVTIYTGMNSGSCGYAFEKDKEYIIYGLAKCYMDFVFLPESDRNQNLERKNTYWITHCSRTATHSKQEVEELRHENQREQ